MATKLKVAAMFVFMLLMCAVGCANCVPKGVHSFENLQYDPASAATVLNLYVPPTDHPLPLVVWIHGGGWLEGNGGRTCSPPMSLLNFGYAVANIDYRMSSEARYPAQLLDCKAAIRWLRANSGKYQLDPDHIGVWGGSAGGHLVALLGTTAKHPEFDDQVAPGFTSDVQAVCDWFGPTDLTQIVSDKSLAGNPALDEPGSPVFELLGGHVKDRLALAKSASPALLAGPGDPPFLILHGDHDPLVPYHQSELLEQALKAAGDEVTLVPVTGAGHGGDAFGSVANLQLVHKFFDRLLKSAH